MTDALPAKTTRRRSGQPGWQKFEERIAALFGGRRRGAATSRGGRGKSDVIGAEGWAIECKLLSRPSFQQLLDAARQAEKNRNAPYEIPIAIVKRNGDHDINSLVVMRLEMFREFFVSQKGAADE